MTLPINKKTFAFAVLLAGLFILLVVGHVHAAAADSSIALKKDTSTGLFTLTVKDPDGLQEFSMTPGGRFSYGGGLSQCPKTFSINNVAFQDPTDFTPSMPGYVIDCAGNTANLEILPPVNGLAKSKVKEEAPPPPAPVAVPAEAPKAEPVSGSPSASSIQYPVPALGGCGSEAECRTYCDNSAHAKECFAFAKKNDLISGNNQKAADEFLNVKDGPGGCNSGASCEAYCNTTDHLDECISFAEKTGYYSGDKLAEAKKFQELVKSGVQFPGGCKDRNTCELYCNDVTHMEECLNFAEKSGFMPQSEIDQARKILPLMQSGETPGGCTSKEQCEKYCADESHSEACIAFGEKAGLISPEDAAMIKKTGGKGPGGCHSKEQCQSYCEKNSDECFKWAQDNGFMSDADLANMKQGLSQFKDQLDKMPPEVTQCLKDAVGEKNFEKLSNGEPVFDRSLEGKMKSCFSQVTGKVSQQLNTLPPEAAQCIKDTIGEDGLKKLQSGQPDPNTDFSSLEGCFKKLQSSFGGGQGGLGGQGSPGGAGAGGFSGPGGCKSIDECTTYCQSKPDECQKFAPPGGGGNGQQGGPGGGQSGSQSGPEGGPANQSDNNQSGTGQSGFQGGPGGCKGPEECQAYCKEHQEECKSFSGGGAPSPVPTPAPQPTPTPTSGGSSTNLSCVTPPSGLVSWWQAEDNAADKIGGNNGALLGGVTTRSGKVGNAFKFYGTDGYVKIGNPANLNFGTGPFSLEAWFNWDGKGDHANIIRKSNYGSGAGAGYWLRTIGYDKTIEFSVGATTQAEGQTLISAPITPGVWHHVVATRDSSDVVKLYVDGQSTGTVIRKASGANSTSQSDFALGAWPDQHSEFFSGMIDEVSVYNRALSASEVQAIFNADSAGKCSADHVQTQSPPQNYSTPPAENSTPPSGSFSGPGGCKNSQECQTYCAAHYTDPACSSSGQKYP